MFASSGANLHVAFFFLKCVDPLPVTTIKEVIRKQKHLVAHKLCDWNLRIPLCKSKIGRIH